MKAEITLENKAKFFAQYWGQSVIFHANSRPNLITFESLINSVEVIDGYCACLKPLSSITDVDARKICEALGFPKAVKFYVGDNLTTYIEDSYGVRFYKYGFVYVFKRNRLMHDETKQANDLAISMGYFLMWMGLSVDNMVRAGWVKLP